MTESEGCESVPDLKSRTTLHASVHGGLNANQYVIIMAEMDPSSFSLRHETNKAYFFLSFEDLKGQSW